MKSRPDLCEIEVIYSHPHPQIKDPKAVFSIWVRYYHENEEGFIRTGGAWDIGSKIRYTREDAIKEAKEISSTIGFPLTRMDEER